MYGVSAKQGWKIRENAPHDFGAVERTTLIDLYPSFPVPSSPFSVLTPRLFLVAMLPVLHKRVGDGLLFYTVVQKKRSKFIVPYRSTCSTKKNKTDFEEYKGDVQVANFVKPKPLYFPLRPYDVTNDVILNI